MIYSSPTLAGLLTVVASLAQDKVFMPNTDDGTQKMRKMYELYTEKIPPRETQPQECPDDISVLLTGSTGSLGSYILQSLLQSPRIFKIYCLTRGKEGLGRLQVAQSEGTRISRRQI